jgi:flavodoxin I
MKKTLVIYDSAFGNTEKVAQAMGEALASQTDVEVRRVTDVRPEELKGLDLLIVGSPVQRFTALPTINEFLNSIPAQGLAGVKVAAFDTRILIEDVESSFARAILGFFVRIFGYAAEPIADKLAKKGGEGTVPPAGFLVEDTEGPMKPGELERAAQWAQAVFTVA